MYKLIKVFLISMTILNSTLCGSGWGSCPAFKYELEEFKTIDYLGKWYEIARHKDTPFQKGECTTAEYSVLENGNIKVLNTENINGKINQAIGEAEKTEDPFKLKITFGNSLFSKLFKGDYRVIDTDYKNFSLVYSCTDFFFGKFYYVWVLSREPVFSEANLQKVLNEIEVKFGIKKDELKFTNQTKESCGDII